jgi:hypothetical protein
MRQIPVDCEKIYVDSEDYKKFAGKRVRLLNLFTVKLDKEAQLLSREVEADVPKIHWVSEPNLKAKMVMPDGTVRDVLAEPAMKNVKADEVIQMPRIGFCRCDQDNGEFRFFFAHK